MLWNPLPISHHNGDIVGYVIRVFDTETLTYVKVVEVGVVLSYILETFHAYNLSIAARTAVGLGPFSNPLHITTLLETYFRTAAHFWVCFRRLFALCNHI